MKLYEIQFNKLRGWQVWEQAGATSSCVKVFKTQAGAIKFAQARGTIVRIWG